MENINVLYDISEDNIIFALAACLREGYQITPIFSTADLWDHGENLILLNILEHTSADIQLFRAMKKLHIKGEIDTRDLNNIYFKTTYQNHAEILKIVKFMNLPINLMTAQNLGDKAAWTSDQYAGRYGPALKAARVKALNTNDQKFLQTTIFFIAKEIYTHQKDRDIDNLVDWYQKTKKTTAEAWKKIKINTTLFNFPDIAFAYLDEISPWLDLEAIKKDALASFKVLTVLQYRQDKQEYTWIGSQLPAAQDIFFLKNKGDYFETTITAPHSEVIRNIQLSIKGM